MAVVVAVRTETSTEPALPRPSTAATPTPFSFVLDTPAADPREPLRHFASRLALETDASDVHADLERGKSGFVVVDARSQAACLDMHLPGAIHLPARSVDASFDAYLRWHHSGKPGGARRPDGLPPGPPRLAPLCSEAERSAVARSQNATLFRILEDETEGAHTWRARIRDGLRALAARNVPAPTPRRARP